MLAHLIQALYHGAFWFVNGYNKRVFKSLNINDMHTFKQWLTEGVWNHVHRRGSDEHGVGYLDPSGKITYGQNHYDLAHELGFKHGSLELVQNGVRLTLSHKSSETTEVGLELMADTKIILAAMKFILDYEPDEVYIDLHNDKTSVNFESFGTHNYREAAQWLRTKRSNLLRDKE